MYAAPVPYERSRLGRSALLKRLPAAGPEGSSLFVPPGATLPPIALPAEDSDALADFVAGSTTGVAAFVARARVMVVAPPFPIEAREEYGCIEPAPLIEALERRRTVGVFLLRLGGFSTGVFRGDALVASKTDQRFVKNRHRKGGQSQRRFERIREKQVHELFGKACEEARATIGPYEAEVQHVFLGGDRRTLQAFRKECDYFERFGDRLMARLLPAPGDPRLAMLASMPREIWSSDVWEWRPEAPGP